MTRFISFLLGKKYEPCHACEVLKEQLSFERSEKKLLIDTLVNIVKPKEIEAPPIEVNQIAQSSALFSRRRAAMEAKDRMEAQILAEKKFVGAPDSLREVIPNRGFGDGGKITSDKVVEQLEKELGIDEGA